MIRENCIAGSAREKKSFLYNINIGNSKRTIQDEL